MKELRRRLEMNTERRHREATLPKLPSTIRLFLAAANVRYSKELFSALPRSPFPTFEDGVLVTKDGFDLYWHVDFDRVQHIKRVLSESSITLSPPVALHLGKGPAYLSLQEIRSPLLVDLAECLSSGLAERVFAANASRGIIIDSYCGYLRDGRSTTREERVYELTYYEAEQGRALEVLENASDLLRPAAKPRPTPPERRRRIS